MENIYTLRQYFKENNFFSDKILKKEYQRVLSPATAGKEKPDEDGITESMVDFSWERDIKISVGVLLLALKAMAELGSGAGHQNTLEGSIKSTDNATPA
jgi:hypothetical protein